MANDRLPTLLALLVGAVGVALLVEAARADTPTTAKLSACPQIAGNTPWARLAFPTCAGYAYHAAYALPDDHPCKVTLDTDGAGQMVITHRYDVHGRYLSETVDNAVIRRCSYDGDHLAWCESTRTQGDGAGDVTRTTATYDHDRLVRLTTSDRTVQAFHYNDAGDIDTVTSGTAVTQLDRDTDHRIVAERQRGDTTRFSYDDDANRVATHGVERFSYDTHGRLTKVDDGSTSDAIAYDTRGRVASITSSFGTRSTFDYCR